MGGGGGPLELQLMGSAWKGFRAIKVVANAFSPAAQLKQASVKENVADEFQPDGAMACCLCCSLT